MRRFLVFSLILVLGAVLGFALWRFPYRAKTVDVASIFPRRFSRPYGMAPAAFEAFVRACNGAKIHPYRIGQTIGNHPLSVGYQARDGALVFRGEKLDYSAAVDVGAFELTPAQRARFLESLAKQGFAAWYREGRKWRGREHIHAIYAPLPIKWQLQSQMREWGNGRRRAGKPRYHWQRRWRRNWN